MQVQEQVQKQVQEQAQGGVVMKRPSRPRTITEHWRTTIATGRLGTWTR